MMADVGVELSVGVRVGVVATEDMLRRRKGVARLIARRTWCESRDEMLGECWWRLVRYFGWSKEFSSSFFLVIF